MTARAVRLRISGRVQGVGYRAWAADRAQRLRLDGWVRNRRDRTVELLAMGPDLDIARLIEACRQGPPAAMVQAVDETEDQTDGTIGFHMHPTV